MTSNAPAPLLAARDLRVGRSGLGLGLGLGATGSAPAVDGLTLTATGRRLLVLGAPRALFEAVAGVAPVTRGDLTVAGTPARAALAAGLVAGAPLDPAMPPAWTCARWIGWSARLAGRSAGDARTLAARAIATMRMESVAATKLGAAGLHVRRATVIAGALATDARVIALEDFSAGLPDATARTLAEVTAQALAPLAWILFAARAPLDAPLVAAADEAIVLAGGHLAGQGAPAALAARAGAYAVRLAAGRDDVDPVAAMKRFVDAAAARGARASLDASGAADALCTLDLGDALRPRDLLAMAEEANAVVVELRPIARAFA